MALYSNGRKAWEGEWVVKLIKNPVKVDITKQKKTKVVHTNRLRHHYIPSTHQAVDTDTPHNLWESEQPVQWEAPCTDHMIIPPAPIAPQRYPQRDRVRPNMLGYGRSRSTFILEVANVVL